MLLVLRWTPGCCDACNHPFHGALKPASICTADTLNICLFKYFQILLLMCQIKCFFLSPDVTSYFVFRIFLVNYGSYRNASSGSFYVLPTRNLAVQSLCGRFGTPCITTKLKKLIPVLNIFLDVRRNSGSHHSKF